MQQYKYKRIAVKIGSNVLSKAEGTLDIDRISHIVDQINQLITSGVEVVLVSSGAVAAGRYEINNGKKLDAVSSRQLWSAIGQVKLMNCYYELFANHKQRCAQVLTTKENFSDRKHYLNMQNCINTMLENEVIPIVNENDTISVNELMFTDNDELSGLISSMMQCEALIILSNVDGVYDGDPSLPETSLINEIDPVSDELSDFISTLKSGFGRGGMLTKSNIAKKIAKQGIAVHVANGKKDNILLDILSDAKVPNTLFRPVLKKSSSVRKWLSHSSSFAKGHVVINAGAKSALNENKATSLLLVGIIEVAGHFEKGDIVSVLDEDGNQIGLGKSQYDSLSAEELIGQKVKRPFIHYDYLYLNE